MFINSSASLPARRHDLSPIGLQLVTSPRRMGVLSTCVKPSCPVFVQYISKPTSPKPGPVPVDVDLGYPVSLCADGGTVMHGQHETGLTFIDMNTDEHINNAAHSNQSQLPLPPAAPRPSCRVNVVPPVQPADDGVRWKLNFDHVMDDEAPVTLHDFTPTASFSFFFFFWGSHCPPTRLNRNFLSYMIINALIRKMHFAIYIYT